MKKKSECFDHTIELFEWRLQNRIVLVIFTYQSVCVELKAKKKPMKQSKKVNTAMRAIKVHGVSDSKCVYVCILQFATQNKCETHMWRTISTVVVSFN